MAVQNRIKESARLWRRRGIDGVDLLAAAFVDQTFPRHFHEGYALGVIERGALGFRYQGRELVAAPGEVNLVVPGEPHDGHAAGPEGWAYRMFYLEPRVLARAAAELGHPASLPHFRAGVLRDAALARDLLALHRDLEAGAGLLEGQSRLLGLLCAWIARHAEARRALPRAGDEPRAVRLGRDFLAAHACEDVSLDDAARAAGLSPFHFLRVFGRSLGLTPHRFLVQCRVRRAQDLLSRGCSPAQAALEAGFADQSHLTRHFKSLVGLTPAAYRNSLQDR